MGFNSGLKGLIYNMMFIYCNWVSTLCQWSGNLYKYRKERVIYKRRNNTKMQNTQKKKTKMCCACLIQLKPYRNVIISLYTVYFNLWFSSVVNLKYQFQVLPNNILQIFITFYSTFLTLLSCDNYLLASGHEKVDKASLPVIKPFHTGGFFINYETGV